MASAKEFVARVNAIEGVDGCLLVRTDGVVLGQTMEDADVFAALMLLGCGQSQEITDKAGFSPCRHVSFSRTGKNHFYLFPIDRYLLGVVQQADACLPDLLASVYRLIGRVSTNGTSGR